MSYVTCVALQYTTESWTLETAELMMLLKCPQEAERAPWGGGQKWETGGKTLDSLPGR